METREIKKHFPIRSSAFGRSSKMVQSVDGISLKITQGETLGLVGESGCGKSTFGFLTLALLEPTSGSVLFEGTNLFDLRHEELRKLRKEMQIVFQDPFSSFNPRKTIRQSLAQPFKIHDHVRKEALEDRLYFLLESVGLTPPESFLNRYPFEVSGGQMQRCAIARALALNPKYVVFDEPVSSLDVSVRGQILKLLNELEAKFNLTSLFISHDLATVRTITDRVAVMYLGELVELASVDQLFRHPLHPYSRALISATAVPNPRLARTRQSISLEGEVPSPIDPPSGCRFHTRCPYARDICKSQRPEWREVKSDHFVACHFAEEFDDGKDFIRDNVFNEPFNPTISKSEK